MEKRKGWKNMNKNMVCRNVQFEVGKEYHQNGEISLCKNGFHFHENRFDIFKYYRRDSLVVEIEAFGNIKTGDNKSVCSDIKIIRVLSEEEVKELCNLKTNSGLHNSGDCNSGDCNSGYRNSGDYNPGDCNSGDCNSGDRNPGDYNSGYRNSGDRNSGYRNSGDYNPGDYNSGDCNSGDCNSGDYNSGHRNSGDYNSGDCNSGHRNSGHRNSGGWNKSNHNNGYFNTKKVKVINVFNNFCDKEDWDNAKKPNFLFFDLNMWIRESEMTKQEKKEHPEFYCQEGYLKTLTLKEAWQRAWDNKASGDIELLESLPNFDWEVFTEISGIKNPNK